MKIKTTVTIFTILFTINSWAFYEGYASKNGDSLKDFIEPEALFLLTENPIDNISIIDVRPENAYQKGHIPTALSFPSKNIMDRLNELSTDQFYIIYCETGIRAQMVIKKLEKSGYTKLLNWGGYKKWPYPLITGLN